MHHTLILIVAVLVALASGVGLFGADVYHDNALVQAAWHGNDLVTLVVAVPLFAISILLMSRERDIGLLLGMGLLAYALYNYAFYVFGAAYNALFLVYVAIVVFSLLGLLAGLTSEQLSVIRRRVRVSRLDRAMGLLVIAVSLVLGGFWVAVSVVSVFSGEPPALVVATGHPTNVTGALDLSLVVTFGLLSGIWLLRGRAWGHIIATIWAVKGAVYMVALAAATASAFLMRQSSSLVELTLWGPIALACSVVAFVLLRSEGEAEAA